MKKIQKITLACMFVFALAMICIPKQTVSAATKVVKYTVRFVDSKSNDKLISKQIVEENKSASDPKSKVPKYEGYTFSKWDTNKWKKVKEDLTVRTVYRENKYTVTYKPNGGEGQPISVTKAYSKEFKLPSKTYANSEMFIRTGYTITGWKYNGKEYKCGETVSKLTASDGKTLVFNAIWTANKYKVSYQLDGGKNHEANPNSFVVGTRVTLKNPTKAGYVFKGWTGPGYSNATKNAVISLDNIKNVILSAEKEAEKSGTKTSVKLTYKANWETKKWIIKFTRNGGDKADDLIIMAQSGESITVPNCPFTKARYKFVEWNTKSNGTGTSFVPKKKTSKIVPEKETGDSVTLYAIWQQDTSANVKVTVSTSYSSVYFSDGSASKVIWTGEGAVLTLPEIPERDGYVFNGWKCSYGTITQDKNGTYKYTVSKKDDTVKILWKRG